MGNNWLVTGPPRSGKSTVVRRVAEALATRGFAIGGVRSPELGSGDERVGFALVDLAGGARRRLATAGDGDGPSVGKYTVDVDAVDEVAGRALPTARVEVDLVVIDEIAPMELASDVFLAETKRTLDHPVPTVGAVHRREDGVYGSIKGRDDVEVLPVTPGTRDALPGELALRIEAVLGDPRG